MTKLDSTLLRKIHDTAAQLLARYYEIPTPDRRDYREYIGERLNDSLPEIAALEEASPAHYRYCLSLILGTYQLAARIVHEERLEKQLEEHALLQELEDLLRVGNLEGAEIFLETQDQLRPHVPAVCDQILEGLSDRRHTFFLAPERSHIALKTAIERFRNRSGG